MQALGLKVFRGNQHEIILEPVCFRFCSKLKTTHDAVHRLAAKFIINDSTCEIFQLP